PAEPGRQAAEGPRQEGDSGGEGNETSAAAHLGGLPADDRATDPRDPAVDQRPPHLTHRVEARSQMTARLQAAGSFAAPAAGTVIYAAFPCPASDHTSNPPSTIATRNSAGTSPTRCP